jgi:hypothetical protein
VEGALHLRRHLIVLRTELGDIAAARNHLHVLGQSVTEKRLHGTFLDAELLRLRAAHAVIDGA